MPDNLDPIPQQLNVKPAFEERYKKILGERYDEFMQYNTSYIRKAVRVNTLKITVAALRNRLKKRCELIPVPWCREGFWIRIIEEERYDIGNLIEHVLGYVYVQDPASMIPPVVLGPKPGEAVLDMCAAPGSKTSQIAAMMMNRGILVANDINTDRIKALGMNLQRCGVANAVITKSYGHQLRKSNIPFDRVLVDAPCSGTGTIRKSYSNLSLWSPNIVDKLSKEQKHLIETGYSILKPGGTLVYSTCTLEPQENEGIVSYLLEKYPDARVEDIDLQIRRSEPILEWDGTAYNPEVRKCLRIYPQDNDTEGFFVAKIVKRK